MFDSHELADLKLNCGTERTPITAHRVVLAARSRFFLQIIKTAMRKLAAIRETLPSEASADLLSIPRFGSPAPAPKSPHVVGDTPFLSGAELEEMSQGSSPGNAPHQRKEEDENEREETLEEVPLVTPKLGQDLANISFGGTISPFKNIEGAPRTWEVNEAISVDGTFVSGFRLENGILELDLPEISFQSLSPIVQFLYSTRMDLTSRNLAGVFNLAHQMGLLSLEPDILAVAPALFTEHSIVDLIIEANATSHGKKLLDSMLFWLSSDLSRTRAILSSPRLAEIPLIIISQMLSSNMFPDEFELYEVLAHTVGGGEMIDELLSKLNFQRMTPEQLLRMHNTGKVKDSIILEALKLKIVNTELTHHSSVGSLIVYDMTLYGESHLSPTSTFPGQAQHTASGAPRYPTATPRGSMRNSRPSTIPTVDVLHSGPIGSRMSGTGTTYGQSSPATSRTPDLFYHSDLPYESTPSSQARTPQYSSTLHVPAQSWSNAPGQHHFEESFAQSHSSSSASQAPGIGISPATLIRRRSLAVASPIDADAAGLDAPTDTWFSDPFQVHAGNWSIVLKTRGGMLYKVGLILNHTTNEWDAIRLESWALVLETHTSPVTSVPFNFGETLFSTGKEWFKIVKGKTSAMLGMQLQTSFKKPQRTVLRVKVLFPTPEQISLVFEE